MELTTRASCLMISNKRRKIDACEHVSTELQHQAVVALRLELVLLDSDHVGMLTSLDVLQSRANACLHVFNLCTHTSNAQTEQISHAEKKGENQAAMHPSHGVNFY